MASDQKSSEDDNVGSGNKKKEKEVEVEVEVEKDLVPKMASHYETLAEKAKDSPKDAKAEEAGKDDNKKKSGEGSGQKKGKNKAASEKGKGGKEDMMDRAREKVSSAKEVAGKTLGSAKEAVAGITERTKEMVIGKAEDEGQDRQEKEEETEERCHDEGGSRAKEGNIGGILGAVREALVDIAVSTKDLVFGKGKGDLRAVEDPDVVYDLGYGGRGEQKQQKEHQKNSKHVSGKA